MMSIGKRLVAVSLLIVAAVSPYAGIQRFPIAADPAKNEMAMSAAFDGTNFLVPVMSDYLGEGEDFAYGTLKAQFVSQTGALIGSPLLLTSSTYGIFDGGAAYGGGQYLIVWEEGLLCGQGTITAGINGVFVAPDGKAGTPFNIASGHSIWDPYMGLCSATVDVPGVIYAGDKFFVVYESAPENSAPGVEIRSVDMDGTVGPPVTVSQSPARLHSAQNQFAFDGSKLLVVYNYDDDYNTKILARLVDPVSGPVGPEMVIDGSSYPSDNPSAVFFDGTRYFVVWTDEVSGPVEGLGVWHFFGNFVSTDGSVSTKFPVNVHDGFKMAPFIAFDGQDYFVTWTDGRNCSNAGCSATGMDIYGQYLKADGTLNGGGFLVHGEAGNDMGGFMGQYVGGKAFGIINTDLALPLPITDDVIGAFWSEDTVAPVISSVQKRTAPFRLRIYGSNFHPDAKVYIGGDPNPWPTVKYGSSTMLTLMKGASLKARFPLGVPVEIKVVNGDGGAAAITYTR